MQFRLYLAIISSRNTKLDTTVSGVVGFEVVADHKQKKSPERVAFFVCRLQAISCKHARERVRQQAKGARGCAGKRKRMSVASRERKRRTISLPLSLTLSFNFIRIKYITLI